MGERPLQSLTDAECCAEVERRYTAIQAGFAAYFAAVRELDRRPKAVPGSKSGSVAATFLRYKLNRASAAADVRAAHALADDLPQLGAALAEGRVSREHVDVAVRALRQVPRHLLERHDDDEGSGMAKVDAWFTETASSLPPPQTDLAAKHLIARLDPDGSDTFDPRAAERREVTIAIDPTGMLVIRGQLDPANGSALKAALDHYSAPAPMLEAEGGVMVPDGRTGRQRNADTLGLIARIALKVAGQGKAEVDRPRVVVHLPAAECEQTGPMTAPWLARFVCDAVVEEIVTGPDGDLRLGRSFRTATTAQRRALIARDGGCVIPGCAAPGGWCDAHHVTYWSAGGETSVANLAMVCPRHHTDIHAGIWSLEIINGIPWARPPTWIDPQRRPMRNTYRDHCRAADQLALDLDPPPDESAA